MWCGANVNKATRTGNAELLQVWKMADGGQTQWIRAGDGGDDVHLNTGMEFFVATSSSRPFEGGQELIVECTRDLNKLRADAQS